MISLLNLSIFVISASLTITYNDFFYSFRKSSSGCRKELNVCKSRHKRCLNNARKLKRQNKQLQIEIEDLEEYVEELETEGEWGSWSGWSACRSISFCGRGFTTRSRSCTPQGKYCEGDTVEVEECLTSGLNKSRSSRSDWEINFYLRPELMIANY